MALSWNEIRDRALAFSKDWADASSEAADAKSFWDAFFQVFGISRRRQAAFEVPVKKAAGEDGYIDLLWKGVLLVEHKSRGRNLDRAFRQALDYFPGLDEHHLPQYVLVSDFARFRLYDLDEQTEHEFALADLSKNIRLFGFMAGYQTRSFGVEDPVNVRAAEQLGRLHDLLKATGYGGHALELYLVRLLFCLFAEDTGIFERRQFVDYLESRTSADGADLGMHLAQLFQVLDTPPERRQSTLDMQLAEFPYVNGRLFAEMLPLASFDSAMRRQLLECGGLDWSRISPAIFGSLFQSIMDEQARRNLGAHYTTEANILKALRPLFLDELQAEFGKIRMRRDRRRLEAFHRKLAAIRILDPACGCGNFLVIAYRELRLLELEVLRELYKDRESGFLDVEGIVFLDVDQFYGIEIEEFPAQIAQVALWLMDHQMNLRVQEEFGQYFIRLPLARAPHIQHGNALTSDWAALVPPAELTYIVGNPPFVGAKFLDAEQRAELAAIFHDTPSAGLLDYVACWYRKAAEYMRANPAIRSAFVSTNSITQGEQVGVLWSDLSRFELQIHFAHRTFQWTSEARGKAAVHCVIIGFGAIEARAKWIYEYEHVQGEPQAMEVSRINPYLADAPDVFLSKRSIPLCDVPAIGIGNKPIDGGHYLFSDEEKARFIKVEPASAKWFRRWLGADEFINGWQRWCLWLGDCSPEELRQLPECLKRVEAVRQYRLASKSPPTRRLAETPTRFHVENMPSGSYLLIPEVSSERRVYIPLGFLGPETLCSNLVKIVPNATLYHFGVLTSMMHMAWVRAVCGRLESRYRYSAGIVYNNFPWPEPAESRIPAIEQAAQAVLDARAAHPAATLADLYDPRTMPSGLLEAHRRLDRAVDLAYGKSSFTSEAARVAFLFERYQTLTSLLPKAGKAARKKARTTAAAGKGRSPRS
ncbi:MAG: class I SAM-dependent DNA methyltransferase [Gammaproteobacteria bacterium]|nr:class I SAM-dependent DNA methyltransferase [Gammaproteobacteria bacterium]